MDNLFGKDDSGNDSDAIDPSITEKEEKFADSIDIEEHDIKVDLSTINCSSNDLSNPNNGLLDSGVNPLIKPTLDTSMEFGRDDDLFHSDIVLPQTTPMTLKERRESKEKSKRELEEEERERMQVLVSNFTEDQLDRYEMFRRSAFPKAAIKRIMQTITGCSVSQNVVIAMSGIAKVFVGEIVEEALDVMEEYGETGPVQPKHLREAVRRLRLQGQIPLGRARKAFFRI